MPLMRRRRTSLTTTFVGPGERDGFATVTDVALSIIIRDGGAVSPLAQNDHFSFGLACFFRRKSAQKGAFFAIFSRPKTEKIPEIENGRQKTHLSTAKQEKKVLNNGFPVFVFFPTESEFVAFRIFFSHKSVFCFLRFLSKMYVS